jgi:hypothetical protein
MGVAATGVEGALPGFVPPVMGSPQTSQKSSVEES